MIYTSSNNRYLKYSTPLIEYIRKNNLYGNENLFYSRKYTDGTFSITNPTNEYKNCQQVNGYPHFYIPLDIILDEINFFIDESNMYDNTIFIRYGDTHPHNPIPKLAQVRNLIIDNSLDLMIGSNAESLFTLGDISIKSLNKFSEKYSLGYTGEEIFINIVNHKLDIKIVKLLSQFDEEAMLEIRQFIKDMQLRESPFVLENELYKNQELYKKFKDDSKYESELKENGELKYTLQEMMFIYSLLKNPNDILISIIGSNQSDHIKKVDDIIKEDNESLDARFLSYGMCYNGDNICMNDWSSKLNNFIEQRKLVQNGKKMDYRDFLKALIIVNSNDSILDFNKLDKHVKNIKRFSEVIDSISRPAEKKIHIDNSNDLLCKMALVGYNLNRSIEMGSPNTFYKYLLGIATEYENHKDQYKNLNWLYYEFMKAGMKRIGYPIFNKEIINKKKVLK